MKYIKLFEQKDFEDPYGEEIYEEDFKKDPIIKYMLEQLKEWDELTEGEINEVGKKLLKLNGNGKKLYEIYSVEPPHRFCGIFEARSEYEAIVASAVVEGYVVEKINNGIENWLIQEVNRQHIDETRDELENQIAKLRENYNKYGSIKYLETAPPPRRDYRGGGGFWNDDNDWMWQ